MKEEADKFFKDASNSCSIIVALITAIAFAAAITYTGGDQASGYPSPMFVKSAAFGVFVYLDILSLVMSMTSLLLFLSILNSRYFECDFVFALPKWLGLGLLSLFISILLLLIAFGDVVLLRFWE